MSTGIKRDKREITAVFHPAKEDYSAHWPDAINAERAGDVLEALLADIDKLGVDLAADVAESVFGDADAAGLGDPLQPRRDIYTIPVDIAVLDDNVAEGSGR